MAAGDGFAPSRPPSKGGVLLIRRPGKKVVEPEVVATSAYPIKSRVPVCCGFSSTKLVGVRGIAPPRLTVSETGPSAVRGEPHAEDNDERRMTKSEQSPKLQAASRWPLGVLRVSEFGFPSSFVIRVSSFNLVHPAGLPPANSPFEAEDDNNFTTDAEMVGRHGAAPCSAV